uniref:Nitroreductase domain-containing protein n=1 Tax=Rhabditophanes sp. KR3021 TaxID=114890 RepID=A0AC35U4P2_9BILA
MTKQLKRCLKKTKSKPGALFREVFTPDRTDFNYISKYNDVPPITLIHPHKSMASAFFSFVNSSIIFQNIVAKIPINGNDLRYKLNKLSTQVNKVIQYSTEKTEQINFHLLKYIFFAGLVIYALSLFRSFFKISKNVHKSKHIVPEEVKATVEPIIVKEVADKYVGDEFAIIDEYDNFVSINDIVYKPLNFSNDEMQKRSQLFYESMKVRRSIRCFSNKEVSLKVIQNLIKTAGTSPSGSNSQPWLFCVVGKEDLKVKIREILENEERMSYSRRMGAKWVLNINDLTINWNKPYLTEAPYLIVIMRQRYKVNPDGEKEVIYFSELSCSIATGFLIVALQKVGLCTVPVCPMNGSRKIKKLLGRTPNEEVLLILPIGYPPDQALVPNIKRKRLEDIIRLY